jgi:putative ABC transport system permease protein
MLNYYFKTAFRNFNRNKSYVFINVFGLGVGIAAALLLFLVIQFETSFDHFHKQRLNTYRIVSGFYSQDGIRYYPAVSFPVAAQLHTDFPQLKEIASIFRAGSGQITIRDDIGSQPKKFHEENIFYAQPEFFNVFDFELQAGNPKTALAEPDNVILTQQVAEKYFGDWKLAIGKTIVHDNKYTYKVAGILKNIPATTDFPLGVVVSYTTLKKMDFVSGLDDWKGTYEGAYTFVVLPREISRNKFSAYLKSLPKKHRSEEDANDIFIAQPLSEMHSDNRFGNYRNHTFSRPLVHALALIGIFLIAIACANFINLATAYNVRRSKEVGVRKILGSNRASLIVQFLTETFLITIVAIVMAIGITALLLPVLNMVLETQIKLHLTSNASLILIVAIIAISVTLLSGLYPALVLSASTPTILVKTKYFSGTSQGIPLRKTLVVLQFAIAQVLIIGTLIVVNQMNYFRNASLGFDKAAVVNVWIPRDSIGHAKIDYLRNKLLGNPAIKYVSFSYASPSSSDRWTSDFRFDRSVKHTDFSANLKWADASYFKLYNLQFIAGHSYNEGDTSPGFVVNETLVRKLGITDPKDIIGKEINFNDKGQGVPIVGVISDFHSYSLKDPIAPVVLSSWKDVYQIANIKITPGSEKGAIKYIENLWNDTYPDFIYECNFLDQTIANFYKQENQLAQLYKMFALVAILISCLGLYGLVSFMAAQRTKEIGIRKVLGASARHIVYLLSKEFSLLILIAFGIAAPVSWFLMHKWLQNYTYRISFNAWIFLLSIGCSIVIAWGTVGYRAITVAMANPIKSLRTE